MLGAAAMDWLTGLIAEDTEGVSFDELATFLFEGEGTPLMDRQRGIRKPARLKAALSIRTSYAPPGQAPPYADTEGPDGLLRYKYRGHDPHHPENVALRRAFQDGLPLIWFVATQPGA